MPGKIIAQSTLAVVYKRVVTCTFGQLVEASLHRAINGKINNDYASYRRNVSAGASFEGFIETYCTGGSIHDKL